MADCVFCAEAGAPQDFVAITDSAYLRRDLYPAAEGHMEAVPRRHVVSFFDLTPSEIQDLALMLRHARDLTPADGYTIGVNEGAAAGRTIDHLHVHIIPRRYGDVADPRGGVRNVLPQAPHPSLWQHSPNTAT